MPLSNVIAPGRWHGSGAGAKLSDNNANSAIRSHAARDPGCTCQARGRCLVCRRGVRTIRAVEQRRSDALKLQALGGGGREVRP